MNVGKPPSIIQELEHARQHVDNLNRQYAAKKEEELSEGIKKALPVLMKANKALTAYNTTTVVPDPQMINEIEQLLNSLNVLKFVNDRSTQIKANALQSSLFANFINEITQLKTHLADREDWKAGRKVKNTQQSKNT